MGTTVTYNNVKLNNVRTVDWRDEIVYDESNTDMMFVRHHMTFECLLHSQGGAHPPVNVNVTDKSGGFLSGDTPSSYGMLVAMLEVPRKGLLVTMGGVPMLSVDSSELQSGAYRDVDNGPKPVSVKLDQISSGSVTGKAIFRLTFEITAAVVHCTGTSGPSAVLSNRWAVTETLDDKAYVTRTIRGKLRLASSTGGTLGTSLGSVGTSSTLDGFYRTMVVPALESGMRRESIDYAASANGLEVDYTVVDRQTHTSAPWPAMRMEATHTESTQDGSRWSSECHVRLDGHPGASKIELIAWGIRVLEDRLYSFDLIQDPNTALMVEQFTVTEYIGDENSVELTLRISTNIFKNDKIIMGCSVEKLGSALQLANLGSYKYDPITSPTPYAVGYYPQGGDNAIRDNASTTLMLQCYLQSPCSGRHAIKDAGGGSAGHSYESVDQTTVSSYQPPSASSSQGDSSKYDKDISQDPKNRQYSYTMSAVENTWEHHRHRVQLPKAATSSNKYGDQEDTCVVAALGAPTIVLKRHYDAERIGSWPDMPFPLDVFKQGSLKGALLYFDFKAHPPTQDNANNNKPIYRLEAFYTYAMNRSLKDGEKLWLGKLGYTPFPQTDNKYKMDLGEVFNADDQKFGAEA